MGLKQSEQSDAFLKCQCYGRCIRKTTVHDFARILKVLRIAALLVLKCGGVEWSSLAKALLERWSIGALKMVEASMATSYMGSIGRSDLKAQHLMSKNGPFFF